MSHPKGLYVLFFAEAWERVSYYGMRALLTLYLVNHLHYEREDALEVYATYTSLVYLTPIFGGFLADRLLGQRKAVLIGGAVMALGHLAMAFEPLLHVALGLLIVGNGFFKPNISTIVGGLYEENDPRRDGGFTIFYMGINLGAFFSPLVCGTLGEKIGWHVGFSAAGVGMVIGLLVFVLGQGLLGRVGFPPGRVPPADPTQEKGPYRTGADAPGKLRLNLMDWVHVGAFIAGSVAFVLGALWVWGLVSPWYSPQPWWVKGSILAAIGLVFFAGPYVQGKLASKKNAKPVEPLHADDYHRLVVIGVLTFFNIFFWMGFEQAGGTMTLFADQQTDRHLFGWEIPASYFQSINPLGIVAMAPFFSLMWLRLDRPGSKAATSTPTKMAMGMIILGVGFIVMYIAQKIAEASGTVGPLWLALVYFIHTVGELCLSPIGLSMVTKLAPARLGSLMMGIWFVSSAVANYFAGTLEHLVSQFHLPVYGVLIATSIGAGVILLVLTPLLKKWMHGRG
ncbi:MAG: peptide MFS transporter [Sandaracinaceae bacterium]|nr:peptide MFS transporter [Sandaracinaceae bacterium]